MPRDNFTVAEQIEARVPNFPKVRFWADGTALEIGAVLDKKAIGPFIRENRSFNVLAISGGAYDGAYGAGILNGWSKAGNRPKFTIVTGISAGALIAPFAFLGPDYDDRVKKAFTGGISQVLGETGALSFLGTPDLRRQTLSNLISEFVDRPLLQAIANEAARGRHLLVVTTNLDAQRAVVWDMGAIAASKHPDALQLFRDVLTASASIPGVFAPTFIEVEAGGRRFREMHVDGGAVTQVFIVPDVVLSKGISVARPQNTPIGIWVIVNNALMPEFEVVESGFLTTISRSLSTLIKSSARTTLVATSNLIGRKNFQVTYIDNNFKSYLEKNYGPDVKPGFNQTYMNAIYNYGYEKAVGSRPWTNDIPLPSSQMLQSAQKR